MPREITEKQTGVGICRLPFAFGLMFVYHGKRVIFIVFSKRAVFAFVSLSVPFFRSKIRSHDDEQTRKAYMSL